MTDVASQLASQLGSRFEIEVAEIRAAEARAAQRRVFESVTAARRQVARDLHDGAQQRLVTLVMSLQRARESTSLDAEARALLDDATALAQLAINDLRELSAGIHPEVLTTRGLRAAVESLASRSGLAVEIVGDIGSSVPEDIEANAYFFVAEALTNVRKHASASRVDIELNVDGDGLTVIVSDNGCGGAHMHASGSGLIGLSDRISALDGQFRLDSPAGIGTTLTARVPLVRSARSLALVSTRGI